MRLIKLEAITKMKRTPIKNEILQLFLSCHAFASIAFD